MRVLLDEQLPRRLARQLAGHYVRTTQQEGWAGLRNGALLARAEAAGFEVFMTADQNLQFQQSLAGSALIVVVLVARSIKIDALLPLIPSIEDALRSAQPGEVCRVGGP